MEDAASADAVPRFFDLDVEICQMSSILGSAGQFHGHQGVVASTLELVRESSDPTFIPEEIRGSGHLTTTSRFAQGRQAPAFVEPI